MTESDFLPGQRWVSDTEPELGLGIVLGGEQRRVTLLFPASGVKRIYALGNAPLSRVRFAAGDRIENQERLTLRVRSAHEAHGLISYQCTTDDGATLLLPEGQLSSHLQFSRPQDRLFGGQLDDPNWFHLRYLTRQRQQFLESSPLLGLGGARTALLPHQLYIAQEVSRRTAPRVLLADEVGLGKTIEACLIVHRQLLSGRASRVLIMVPPTLLNQWLVELLRRFNLRFSLFDQERCAALDESAPGDNPFASEQLVLCSLDLIRENARRRQELLAGHWDLLVVDEAHHLQWTPEAASPDYLVVEALAQLVPGVLLLTATPEQLGRAGHFARLRLLDPDRFHDLEEFIQEEQRFEPVAKAADQLLSEAQALPQKTIEQLLETLDEQTALPLLAVAADQSVEVEQQLAARRRLVDMLLDRHGTGRVLFRNSRSRIKGFPTRELYRYPLALPDEYLTASADPYVSPRQRLAPETIDRGSADRPWWAFDPRIDWLIDLVRRLDGEKLLLICASADTVLALEQALRQREGMAAALFHEGMSIIERDRAAAWFADLEEGCRLLLCSEIGSEGRNFQFAHHLVLFDLPLDPDLLEQRIGRLDRIGQRHTIRIHVPYFEQSAQAVMLHWYHQGLNAFQHTCPPAHSIFSRLQPALLQMLEEPDGDPQALSDLLESTQQLREETGRAMERGRDHLLELNSCRQPQANSLAEDVRSFLQHGDLAGYVDQLLAAYGVESEPHSPGSIILRPGPQMLHDSFPGLPADGMTATFDRALALSQEDRQFLTWEHPLVRDGMALLSTGFLGSSGICAVDLQLADIPRGSLLLELLWVVECPAPARLQVGRFLPPTLLRQLLDQQLQDRGDTLSREQLHSTRVPLEQRVGAQLVAKLAVPLRALLERGESLAQQRMPTIIASALRAMSDHHNTEIERLQALQRVNPNVRDEEIASLQRQADALREHLRGSRLRLDAVQVIAILVNS